jgi:endonuclease G
MVFSYLNKQLVTSKLFRDIGDGRMNFLFKIFMLLAIIGLPSYTWAFQCGSHTSFGVPSSADQLLCRQGYALGYSYKHRGPEWVQYAVSKESVEASCSSDPNFRNDRDIPEEYQSTNHDYTNSGYDRGHMAPRATIDFNCASETESVLYSNASPQDPGLNQVGWKQLEADVRGWTEQRQNLFVVTGAIFHGNKRIRDRVSVPSHYYKIIYDLVRKESISFLFPNEPLATYDLDKGIVTISEISKLSGQSLSTMFNIQKEYRELNF